MDLGGGAHRAMSNTNDLQQRTGTGPRKRVRSHMALLRCGAVACISFGPGHTFSCAQIIKRKEKKRDIDVLRTKWLATAIQQDRRPRRCENANHMYVRISLPWQTREFTGIITCIWSWSIRSNPVQYLRPFNLQGGSVVY